MRIAAIAAAAALVAKHIEFYGASSVADVQMLAAWGADTFVLQDLALAGAAVATGAACDEEEPVKTERVSAGSGYQGGLFMPEPTPPEPAPPEPAPTSM